MTDPEPPRPVPAPDQPPVSIVIHAGGQSMVPVGVGSQDNRFPVVGTLGLPERRRPRRDPLRRLLRVASFGQYTPAPLTGGHGSSAYLATAPVPWHVPKDVPGFVGRREELKLLDSLAGRRNGADPAMVTFVITGAPGIGKTALAVHWAHRRRGLFPDGQLYMDLRGYGPGPSVGPAEVLESFLLTLGIDRARIPATVEDRAGLYRSILAVRRVLVVLDNAASDEQVRSLLPGTASCAAMVTSRSSMAGLVARDGARRIDLDVLRPDESIALLRDVIGAERVDADPEAAAHLAAWCAHLPLALRIAAQRAQIRRHTGIAELVRDLAAEQRRLDALAHTGDETEQVRAVFSWSYRALAPAAARIWRLLGLHAGPVISVHAAAALADVPPTEVRRLLDVLLGVHLLEETSTGRYRLHDLLRAYAAERAEADATAEERHAALVRVLNWYVHTAHAAAQVVIPYARRRDPGKPTHLQPELATAVDALNHCEAERENLFAAARQAAELCEHHVVCQLADALWWALHERRGYYEDAAETSRLALTAARALNDRALEADALVGLGHANRTLGRGEDAITHFEQALELYREIGDQHRLARAHNMLCLSYGERERLDDAVRAHREAMRLYQATGDRHGEGGALLYVGYAYANSERYDEAVEHLGHAREIFSEIGYRHGEALAVNHIGIVSGKLGQFDDAVLHLQQALGLFLDTGDVNVELSALTSLGHISQALSRFDEAEKYHRRALAVSRRVGGQPAEGVGLANLGIACCNMRRHDEAVTHLEQALPLLREVGDRANVLNQLGVANQDRRGSRGRRRRFAKAIDYYRQALALFREAGNRIGQANALHNLGMASSIWSHSVAENYLKQAESLYADLGSQDGVQLARRGRKRIRRDRREQLAGMLVWLMIIGFQLVADSAPQTVHPSRIAWANRPTVASYSPADEVEISRRSVGSYSIRFNGLATEGGVAHVTAYGSTAAFCAVYGWAPDGAAEWVAVRCFDSTGGLADSRFVVTFADRPDGSGGFSYLWADSPSERSYRPARPYRYDSTGGTAAIERTAIGRYRVFVPASFLVPAYEQFYQVTAYQAAAHCKVSARPSDSGTQEVTCRGADGDPMDAQFSLSFSWRTSFVGRADQSRGPRPADRVSEIDTGYYLASWQHHASDVGHVVAYAVGDSDAYCHVRDWHTVRTDLIAAVVCWSATTLRPTNAEFVLAESR